MRDAFEPERYWQDRLTEEFTLRGAGHLEYTKSYNVWLYRRKRAALDEALEGIAAGDALDVGSGVGWVVRYLIDHGWRVAGCDITDVAVIRLRETFPAGHFFKLAVGSEPIPLATDSFDIVTMLDVAYHIVDDAAWGAALTEIARVLRPEGRLVVTDTLGAEPVHEAEHVRKRSRTDWERASADAGLRIVRTGPLFRWLSRRQRIPGWRRVPDGVRGGVEFALERFAPIEPHMRWAVLTKR